MNPKTTLSLTPGGLARQTTPLHWATLSAENRAAVRFPEPVKKANRSATNRRGRELDELIARIVALADDDSISIKAIAAQVGITHVYALGLLARAGYRAMRVTDVERAAILAARKGAHA